MDTSCSYGYLYRLHVSTYTIWYSLYQAISEQGIGRHNAITVSNLRTDLRAAVVKDFDMSSKRLIHYVRRDVLTLCQVPQQHKHLVRHDTFFVVLGQPPNQLQQFLTLLLACMHPTTLYVGRHQISEYCNNVVQFCSWMWTITVQL